MSYPTNQYSDVQYPPQPQMAAMPLQDLTPDYAADNPQPSINEQKEIKENINDSSSESSEKLNFSFIRKTLHYFAKWYRIVGLVVTIFFFFYMICLFSVYFQEYNNAKDDSSNSVVSIPASVPALHWVLCIVALTLGIFLILTNSVLHWAFALVACVLFAVFWITNSVVVSQTSIYKAAENHMPLLEYNTLKDKLVNGTPVAMLRVHGSYTTIEYYHDSDGHRRSRIVTHDCYTQYVPFSADTYTDSSSMPEPDQANRDIIFIGLNKTIQWTDDAEVNILSLARQFRSAMEATQPSIIGNYEWQRQDTVEGFIVSAVVSDNELTGLISDASRIALSIFWAPAAFIYKLAASSFYMPGSVVKTNCTMSQNTYDFYGYNMICD